MKRLMKLIFGHSRDLRRKRIREFCVTVVFGLVFCAVVAALLYYLNGGSQPRPSTPGTKLDPWTKNLPDDISGKVR